MPMFVRLVFILGGMLAAVIVAVLVVAAARPDDYRVERTVLLKAPPEKVYTLIEDVRRWPDWSMEDEKDPQLKRAFFGPSRGTGAGYDWTGGPHSGKGRATITEAVPPSRVVVQVLIKEPYEDTSKLEINLSPHDSGTLLRWAASGGMSYFTKVTTAFTTMDAVMGPRVEDSLAKLKLLAEG
jgi:uncharacterized protein YndB with AHSA1/START domain